jgi:small nuclear ribonucleoprotein (snRNP)-like protein
MSLTSRKSAGVPMLLLHECQGAVVTVELKSGDLYRGEMDDSEDSWNMLLKNVTWTRRDGQTRDLDAVFIRGERIVFIIVPDMCAATLRSAGRARFPLRGAVARSFAKAPLFKRVMLIKKGKGHAASVNTAKPIVHTLTCGQLSLPLCLSVSRARSAIATDALVVVVVRSRAAHADTPLICEECVHMNGGAPCTVLL